MAMREAKKRNVPLADELTLLICHCLLHAKGYDDRNERDRLKMRQKEFELLSKVL